MMHSMAEKWCVAPVKGCSIFSTGMDLEQLVIDLPSRQSLWTALYQLQTVYYVLPLWMELSGKGDMQTQYYSAQN